MNQSKFKDEILGNEKVKLVYTSKGGHSAMEIIVSLLIYSPCKMEAKPS